MTSEKWFLVVSATLVLAFFGEAGYSQGTDTASKTQIILIPPDEGLREALGEVWRVVVDGPLDRNSGTELARLLSEANVRSGIVHLNSPGGNILASMQMGLSIREHGLDTSVSRWVGQEPAPGLCASACVYAYLGGKFRFLNESSVLAVHRFMSPESSDSDLEIGQAVSGEIIEYLRKLDVKTEVYERISRVPASSLYKFEPAEAIELGIVNNGRLPAQWSIETTDLGVYLRGAQDTIYGGGKTVFSCAPKGMVFSPYYYGGERRNKKIEELARAHRIVIGKDRFEIGNADSRLMIMKEALVGMFLLDDSILPKISDANSVGYFAVMTDSGDGLGFDVEFGENRDLIERFFRQCIAWRNHLKISE